MTSNVLAGLKGIAVLVEDIMEDDAKPVNDLLNREAYAVFGGYASECLRQADIPVVPLDRTKDVAYAVLYLRPTLVRSPYKGEAANGISDEIVGFSLSLELKQMAYLVRDAQVRTYATAWQSGSTGVVLLSELGAALFKQIKQQSEKFAHDFKATQDMKA